MSKELIIQTISIMAILSIAGAGILPKLIAQPSSPGSNTTATGDVFEKLLSKVKPAPTMAGVAPNKYTAFLIICKSPYDPKLKAEDQCDLPIVLH